MSKPSHAQRQKPRPGQDQKDPGDPGAERDLGQRHVDRIEPQPGQTQDEARLEHQEREQQLQPGPMAQSGPGPSRAQGVGRGSGGGQREADRLGVPLLGEVPIDIATREAGDTGMPVVARAQDGPVGREFMRIAAGVRHAVEGGAGGASA